MQEILAKLTLKCQLKFLPASMAFVKEIALENGFDESGCNKLMLITEEACLNVIQHAFKDSKDEYFDIIIERGDGQFVIAIEDKGLPYDFDSETSDKSKGFGMTLMKEYSDEIKFINLGQKGKRIELIKHFTNQVFEKSFSEDISDKLDVNLEDTSQIPLEIRLMNSDEAVKLERLMFKVYGYTYAELVYFPERIKELIEKGLLISTVAVTPEGEFAGHQGLKKSEVDSKIAEIAMGAVDPRFRGRGLFEKLKTEAFGYVKKQGLHGLFGEAVTTHGYSQKANFAMGGKISGILLGYIPQDITFKKINENQSSRQTAVLFYTRLNNEPKRKVYLPQNHIDMIQKIYDNGGFTRESGKEEFEFSKLEEKSIVNISINQSFSVANIDLIQYGKDIEKLLKVQLRELCLQKTDVIFLDLPLSDPATQYFCNTFESLGFLFSGVLLEFRDGDILRLQYLNNVLLEPEKTVIITDFGKELFDYIISSYKKI